MNSTPIDHVVNQWLVEQRLCLADALSPCESPIESLLAAALLSVTDKDGQLLQLCNPTRGAFLSPVARGRAGVLHLQYPLQINGNPIRADLVIFGSRSIIIEADGHDFHERTKAQATADKRRDRALTALGWTPLRFTGSEIYRDAMACAGEVMRLLGHEPLSQVSVDSFDFSSAARVDERDAIVAELNEDTRLQLQHARRAMAWARKASASAATDWPEMTINEANAAIALAENCGGTSMMAVIAECDAITREARQLAKRREAA